MLVDVLVPLGKRVLKQKFYALKSTFIQNKNTEKKWTSFLRKHDPNKFGITQFYAV